MALHHFAISLCDTQIDATETPTMTWHTHSLLFFSQTRCSRRSSVHIFRNQDKQFVLCHFVIFIVIDIFRAIKIQIQNNQSQQVGPCPLDQAPVSRVFQRFHVLSCTHDTKSDAELQAWWSTSDRKNIGSLNLNRFIINAFTQSHFQ